MSKLRSWQTLTVSNLIEPYCKCTQKPNNRIERRLKGMHIINWMQMDATERKWGIFPKIQVCYGSSIPDYICWRWFAIGYYVLHSWFPHGYQYGKCAMCCPLQQFFVNLNSTMIFQPEQHALSRTIYFFKQLFLRKRSMNIQSNCCVIGTRLLAYPILREKISERFLNSKICKKLDETWITTWI